MMLLLLAQLAFGASYDGALVKGEPWRIRLTSPHRGELCLNLTPAFLKKPWLVNGLHVKAEAEAGPGKNNCLRVKRMLPASYDPGKSVKERGRRLKPLNR
jgi:hypothetical protein